MAKAKQEARIGEMERTVENTAAKYLLLSGRFQRRNNSHVMFQRRFKSHYGVSPKHVVHIWDYLEDTGIFFDHPTIRLEHVLWTLDLQKTDSSEHALQSWYGADEKTIRKWTTIIIEALSDCGVVRLSFHIMFIV